MPALLSHPQRPLNKNQFIAVKLAMKQDITVIQGPPGTVSDCVSRPLSTCCLSWTRLSMCDSLFTVNSYTVVPLRPCLFLCRSFLILLCSILSDRRKLLCFFSRDW